MTPEYSALPDPDAEALIFATLAIYAEEEHSRYASVGLMADAVDKKLLWRHHIDPEDGFPCRSFARWTQLCAYPRSTLYAAMRDVQELLPDVSAADLAQIPQSNFRAFKQLSTAVRRDPAVLKAAKGRTEALVAHVKKHHTDQHLEADTMFRVPLNETQLADVEAALEKAMARGCGSRSEALWMLAVDYLSGDTPLAEVDDAKCAHS